MSGFICLLSPLLRGRKSLSIAPSHKWTMHPRDECSTNTAGKKGRGAFGKPQGRRRPASAPPSLPFKLQSRCGCCCSPRGVMAPQNGRVAVVTGASSGIGAAIAYQLQDAGFTVVALARRKDAIAAAVAEARRGAEGRGHRPRAPKAPQAGALHCLECDVSKEEDILAAFKWVKDNLKKVHVLVNNAGVGGPHSLTGPTDSGSGEWKRILDVNVLGLSLCTREAVKLMKEKGIDDGHVVHIGSVAGHVPPLGRGEQSMYFASKHAVRVLTEGLRKELVAAKSKIRVTEVSPGMVKTNFFDAMKIAEELLWRTSHLLPEDVANAVLYAVTAPSHVQIHEIIIKPVGEQF